jgi:ABC-2 type transport system permease protein
MRKAIVIAVREYLAVVRSKAFVVSLVLLPVMMLAPHFIERLTRRIMDVNDRTFAVIDRTPGERVYVLLDELVTKRNKNSTLDKSSGRQIEPRFVLEKIDPVQPRQALDQRYELAKRVREGKLFGFLEVGRDTLTVTPSKNVDARELPDEQVVRYQSNTPTYTEFRKLATDAIHQARVEESNVPKEKREYLEATLPVVDKALPYKDASGIHDGKSESQLAPFLIPFGLSILMLVVVMIGAIPMMQGVIEEKQQRISEVLLGSVRPFELMAGKVLGIVATSATLIFVYLGGAYIVAQKQGYAQLLPSNVIAWFVVFALLAVLMYGSIYIAIGASVSDTREMQSLMLPVQLLLILPLMIVLNVIQNPNGPLARLATWFPPATPMIAITRIAVPPGMPLWEALLAVLVVLAATAFFVWASGRIFRVGILMSGKGADVREMMRWVLSG